VRASRPLPGQRRRCSAGRACEGDLALGMEDRSGAQYRMNSAIGALDRIPTTWRKTYFLLAAASETSWFSGLASRRPPRSRPNLSVEEALQLVHLHAERGSPK
jgi:hypothetical protein